MLCLNILGAFEAFFGHRIGEIGEATANAALVVREGFENLERSWKDFKKKKNVDTPSGGRMI
jgi:threonine synthase